MSDNTQIERPMTNMGWPGRHTWHYTHLTSSEVDAQLTHLASPTLYMDVGADSVTIQPSTAKSSEDRLSVQAWNLPSGTWTFAAVFDGHGGDTTAIHAVDTIPKDMRSRLSDALAGADAQTTDLVTIVPRVIQASLTAFEEGILADFMALFPGGLPMVEEMSAEEIKAIVNDDGENLKKVHRCMRGTTALIALVDPRKENVWVASLGDGQAILSSKDVASNAWKGHVLCGVHNGFIQSEVERIRAEHPGEEECVIGFRVLGAIMVTRALGDEHFKLAIEWTKRVFMLVNPGFNFRASKVTDYFPRCITPPYVSSTAEIRHRRLDRSSDRFIVLASDGLTDMFSPEGGDPILSEENADKIAHVVGAAGAVGGNLSLRLLREGFGGDNLDKCSRNLTAEMEGGAWMDDTTVIVLHL